MLLGLFVVAAVVPLSERATGPRVGSKKFTESVVLGELVSLLGRSAGVALLVILAGMKLLESRSLRDAYAATFLSYFLVITNFLFSQTIPTGVYMFVVVVVTSSVVVVAGSAVVGGTVLSAAPAPPTPAIVVVGEAVIPITVVNIHR